MNLLMTMAAATPSLSELLIGFLVLVVVLLIIAGLIWVIETYIMKQQIPGPVKLVIGIVLIILVIIWGLRQFNV